MAKTYLFCNSGTYDTTSVSVSTSSCVYHSQYDSGNGVVTEYTRNVTFALTQATTESLRVWYTVDYEYVWYGGTSTATETRSLLIPAGVTSYTIPSEQLCRYIYNDDDDDRADEDEEWSNWTVIDQVTVPDCDQPVGCSLSIDNIYLFDPSVRFAADGYLGVQVSGASGATDNLTYKINGVTYTTSGSRTAQQLTGLTAGNYTVYIEQGICSDQRTVTLDEGEFRSGDFTYSVPNELSATENPIILTLGTAINDPAPVPSKSYFKIAGTVTDGDSITIDLTYPQAYSATFYGKGFPSKNNYFLASTLKNAAGTSVGSNTAAEIATSLAEVLSNDSVISRLYYIRVSTIYVYLVAKENNSSLDLDETNTVTIDASNITLTKTQYGVSGYDGQIEANYSLYADIFVDDDSQYGDSLVVTNFNKITQIELPYSQDNTHKFDLSQVLKNFVSTPKIDFGLTGATTLPQMMAAYYCDYGEKYPLVTNSTTKKSRSKGSTAIKYVINSALQWEDINTMADYLGDNIHDIKADFSGTFTGSYGDQTFVFDDIYFSTGTTANTTNIGYKIINSAGSQTLDWQSSPTFTGITFSYAQGTMYISGETSGFTFVYGADWYSNEYAGASITSTSVDDKTNIKFLTNAPNPKQVQRNSSEFLYFIIKKQYGKILKVKADLSFYDGTSLTGETLYTIPNSENNYGGVYCVPSGYEQLSLEDYETYSGGTRKIRSVDFGVYQENDAGVDVLLTEERSYRYEIDEQPRRYGVAFLNKLGTWDIFDFSGEIVDDVDYSSERYEVPREVGLQGNSPKGFQANTVYGTSVLRKHNCNSGWINLDTFNWLIELLSSNRIYNYTEDAQPFLIKESVGYTKSSNDDLYQIDVVFAETLKENNISV